MCPFCVPIHKKKAKKKKKKNKKSEISEAEVGSPEIPEAKVVSPAIMQSHDFNSLTSASHTRHGDKFNLIKARTDSGSEIMKI